MSERALLDVEELQQRVAELVLLTAPDLPRERFQRVMDSYERLLVWLAEQPSTQM